MADTAVETIGDIIEEQGGTTDARTVVDALDDLSEVLGTGSSAVLIATDSLTQQVLTTMGYESTLIAAPSQALMAYIDNPSVRLCWMRGGMLEIAPAVVSIELDTSTVYMSATGTLSRILGGIGENEWAITAL